MVALMIAAASAACGGRRADEPPGVVKELGDLPEHQAVESAGARASTAGASLTLEAEAWHDDMPVIGGEDRSNYLLVSTKVRSSSETMPEGIRIERVYVVRGLEVWSSSAVDEHEPSAPNEIESVVRDGPTWRGPETVDVIVRVRGAGGEPVYVAHHGVEITSAQ